MRQKNQRLVGKGVCSAGVGDVGAFERNAEERCGGEVRGRLLLPPPRRRSEEERAQGGGQGEQRVERLAADLAQGVALRRRKGMVFMWPIGPFFRCFIFVCVLFCF